MCVCEEGVRVVSMGRRERAVRRDRGRDDCA